jgi:hypothetical protein
MVKWDIIRKIVTQKRFLMYDRILSEAERTGMEEYLQRKWISTFDLDVPVSETEKAVRPR